jgi:hypothetical protein
MWRILRMLMYGIATNVFSKVMRPAEEKNHPTCTMACVSNAQPTRLYHADRGHIWKLLSKLLNN